MSSSPFMQLYVGDYLADTLDLTTEQHGAYLLLLMTMWRHDAKLPDDNTKLCRVARVSPKRWPAIWSEISRFFTSEDGFITNARLTKEHQKAVSISQERKNAGSRGGTANALKRKELAQASATDLLKHSQKSEPDIKKEEPNGSSKKRGTRLPEDWMPDEVFGKSEGMSADEVAWEADKFRDYWRGQPGQRGVKLDWQATWRNWVRNSDREKRKPTTAKAANWRDEPEYRNVL